VGHVFISYSRSDAPSADRLSAALRAAGVEVWIDVMAIDQAKAFDRQIEEALVKADGVIVLWTASSIASDWVRNEAQEALRQGKLIPLLLDAVEPPLQFRHIQSIDFRQWDGDDDGDGFRQVMAAVGRLVPHASPATRVERTTGTLGKPLERAGILFADPDRERRFSAFYAERYFGRLRFGFGIGAGAYALLGVLDMINMYGSVVTNQFRFVVAAPIMLAFLALTYLPATRRYMRLLSICYFAVGILLALLTMKTIVSGGLALLDGSVISAVCIVVLLFVTVLPLRTPEALICAAMPLLVQQNLDWLLPMSEYNRYLLGSLTVIAFVFALTSSWWGEVQARRWFSERPR
jgi:hypothetical protein